MRYYQDRFKNFYATAIQQAWINCKKRSNHWHIKYDGTSSEKKAIHCDKDYYFINEKIIEFNVADRFHDLAEKKKCAYNDRQVDVKIPNLFSLSGMWQCKGIDGIFRILLLNLIVKLGLFLSPRTGF
ncbi:unnamed protein product [Rhizophagus irregularis]|nr:unnamed protein product [Rhizophagus irregularis]